MKFSNTITNETIAEIAQAIAKAFSEKGYTYFGVRTGRIAEIGEGLEPSHDWDHENDWFSDELLTGTSSTGIGGLWFDGESEDEEEIKKTLTRHCECGYYGDMTYIIGGKRADYGEDVGELIIADAEVIYIIS